MTRKNIVLRGSNVGAYDSAPSRPLMLVGRLICVDELAL
jgi:hypothetical protein